MELTTKPRRYPSHRGVLAAGLLVASFGAAAEVGYPQISAMSEFERAALESGLTSLATSYRSGGSEFW